MENKNREGGWVDFSKINNVFERIFTSIATQFRWCLWKLIQKSHLHYGKFH